MTTFLIAFCAFLLIIIAMSVGVLMGGKPIKGSCGGVGAALKEDDYVCDLCGNDPNKCEEEQGKQAAKQAVKDLAYDASAK
jgi:uncharacterized protein